MGNRRDKLILISGLCILFHAAYSAAQHRTYVRLTEKDATRLPGDVVLQCIIGTLLACYGVVSVAGTFRDIKVGAELDNKTWETLTNRPAFYTFAHRGAKFFVSKKANGRSALNAGNLSKS